jgi:proteasome lid subunit RPN8/RPN11
MNTTKGLEKGGILAGSHLDDHYQVTHLLVPEQSATSTSWDVYDERQIPNYFSYNSDLIMLGLIHTHPNMISFLSSVDLHGLWDYARDNPSLVSIVLAPKRKTAPAFCLTEHGLSAIGKCQKNGHHKHRGDDRQYYEVASHAIEDETFETIVVDFRIPRYISLHFYILRWRRPSLYEALIDRQTDLQTDLQTNRQTDRLVRLGHVNYLNSQ